MAKKKYTETEMFKLIEYKFADTQKYVVFPQVADGTGYGNRSWIDAIVISLWPSLGCSRLAIEIKCARGDWLKEINNPEKNRWARDYCHQFAYLAPDDVIKEAEVPAGRGLYRPYGKTIRTVIAPQHKDDAKSDDMFVASLARSFMQLRVRLERDMENDFKENSHEYKRCKVIEDVLTTFFKSRELSMPYEYDPAKFKEKLEIALNKSMSIPGETKKIEDLKSAVKNFKSHLLGIIPLFIAFAYVGVDEVNDLGEMLHGWNSSKAIKTMQERLKADLKGESGRYLKDGAKSLLKTLKLLGMGEGDMCQESEE